MKKNQYYIVRTERIMKKNQYYIVRTERAGVFFGKIESKTSTSVIMTDVRKLFSWSGAAAVEQLAEDGTANPNGCKFTISDRKSVCRERV